MGLCGWRDDVKQITFEPCDKDAKKTGRNGRNLIFLVYPKS